MNIKNYNLNIDQRAVPTGESNQAGLTDLVNVRLHPADYYISDRGWEPLKVWSTGNSHGYQTRDFEPIRFCSLYERHNGAEQYYLYEQGGYLKFDYGNGDLVDDVTRYLPDEVVRHIPEQSEPGTQLVPANNWAMICNGYDNPFKWYGGTTTTQFGYRVKPAPPEVYKIAPSYQNGGLFGETAFVTSVQYEGDASYGITEDDERGGISYGYKVFFISDTNSWSPMSEPTLLDFRIANTSAEKGKYISFLRLPIGPSNTKARVLCRTQQLTRADRIAGIASNDYFIVKVINDNTSVFCSDHIPDSSLSLKAPTELDSVPIPSTFNYGAIWDNRMWISGGSSYYNKVLYSKSAKLEEFGAFDNISFSTGGAITALITFNQFLIVFCERAIHVITKSDTYRSTTITNSIGTTATNSIRDVDGVGLVFLSYDGFYAISLAQASSSSPIFDINKISEPITATISRLTLGALPRATATYNPIEREYWCHMPVDGVEENTMGCVLHQNLQWSFRHADVGDRYETMAITTLANDGKHTILGMIPYDDGDEPLIQDGTWHNLGLQVWSASNQAGNSYASGSLFESRYYFTKSITDKLDSKLESTWITLGAEAFYKKIDSIEILGLGTGNTEITLQYAKNYNLSGESNPWITLDSVPMMASHSYGSSEADAVYDTATMPPVATWAISRYTDIRPMRLKWSLPSEEILSIKFRFTSSSVFALHSFLIKYDLTTTPIVNMSSRR